MNRDRDRDRDKTDTTRARAREREQRNGDLDRNRKHSRERSFSPKRVGPARDGERVRDISRGGTKGGEYRRKEERERDANQESAIHARERERAGWGGQESSRGKRERSRDELDKIRDWSLDRDRGKSDKGRAEIDRERYRGKQRNLDRGKVGNAGGKKEGCRDRERVGNSDHSLAKSLDRTNIARAGGRGSSRGREGRREREKEEKTVGNGGGEVGKGRETDRYSERDSNRDRQRGRERDRKRDTDREREYTQAQRPSKQVMHVNKLNQQPSNSSGTVCSSRLIATQIKCELHNKNRGTVNLMREPNPTTHGTTMRWVCKPGKECKGADGRTAEVIVPHITQIKCEVHNKNRSAANLMQEKNPHTQGATMRWVCRAGLECKGASTFCQPLEFRAGGPVSAKKGGGSIAKKQKLDDNANGTESPTTAEPCNKEGEEEAEDDGEEAEDDGDEAEAGPADGDDKMEGEDEAADDEGEDDQDKGNDEEKEDANEGEIDSEQLSTIDEKD